MHFFSRKISLFLSGLISQVQNKVETVSTMEVKSVGTFPVILLKLATPPLSPQTKLNLGAKWVRMSAFLATTLLGEVGERRDEPKAEQKNCP